MIEPRIGSCHFLQVAMKLNSAEIDHDDDEVGVFFFLFLFRDGALMKSVKLASGLGGGSVFLKSS